jgi:hypothetical protein
LYRIELVASATKTPKGFLVTDVGVNLGNRIGVNLGITPHPPVLIHRSESTLPLVVMALNNPLLL